MLINRLMDMPMLLSGFFILGIIAPVLVLVTFIPNTVEEVRISELLITMAFTVPSVCSSVLIYNRKSIFIYLYPVSYIVGTSVTPFLFSTLFEKINAIENLYSSLFVSFFLLCYFLFSKEVKNYLKPG